MTAARRTRPEYIVLRAPGWPSGYKPTPNTLERGRDFVARHGGELHVRMVSDWSPLASDETQAERNPDA